MLFVSHEYHDFEEITKLFEWLCLILVLTPFVCGNHKVQVHVQLLCESILGHVASYGLARP